MKSVYQNGSCPRFTLKAGYKKDLEKSMNKTGTDLTNDKVPVFKTGDYVQLTRAQDKHLPVGTTAMVNERFTDGINFNRDAYAVTFDDDHDIVRVQDLAPANISQALLSPGKKAEKASSRDKPETSFPPNLKRTIEGENNLLEENANKKQKKDHTTKSTSKQAWREATNASSKHQKELMIHKTRNQNWPIK